MSRQKDFVKTSRCSCLSSHHHHHLDLVHEYCACLVSTILWSEVCCTCPHFMNFTIKLQALNLFESISCSCSCIYWRCYYFMMLLQHCGASLLIQKLCSDWVHHNLPIQQLGFSSCPAPHVHVHAPVCERASNREQKAAVTDGCLRWLVGSKVRLC